VAVLPDADRFDLWAAFMREASDERTPIALTKPQLRAAVDAADAWVDDNAASYNSALPAAARNNLTAKQKAQLLMHVMRRRYEVS
jgi:hypothetical protein